MAQEKGSQLISSQCLQTDLISKSNISTTKEGWSAPLALYKNYWLRPRFAEIIMRLQDTFKAHPDDNILVSNPKCGTTWLKALAFAITNRSRYDFDNHPLLSHHPHEVVPYIEILPRDKDPNYVEALPSPRLLATHMPFSLLPKSLIGSGCRIVYICRDPKDVFASRWHYENNILIGQNKIDLEVAFNMFCEGFSEYGPFWDHCLEYWRESIATPDKVLFLKYEDMMLEPVKHVILLAKFLRVPFTEKEHEDKVPEEVVRLCSFDHLSSLESNQVGHIARQGNRVLKKSAYFRKGKVGDWVNHMSEEMARKLDRKVEEKLKGSGLVF